MKPGRIAAWATAAVAVPGLAACSGSSAGEGRFEVAVEHAAAAGRRGGGHRAGVTHRLAFKPGEHAAGVAGPALAGVGLDQIRHPRDDHRLLVP